MKAGSWLGERLRWRDDFVRALVVAGVAAGLPQPISRNSRQYFSRSLAATFHAPLFATMMVFEMVGDVRFLVPLTLGTGFAYGLARFFQPGSAYTFGFGVLGVNFQPGTYTEVSGEVPTEQ